MDNQIWRPNFFRLFLTHKSEEKVMASSVQAHLLDYYIHAFVAHEDIKPTRQWENEILMALNTADALVAMMHPGFHTSYWTDQEVGIALGRELFVIPIMLGETPYGFLGRYQALNANGKQPGQIAEEIFEILLDQEQFELQMANVRVRMLVESTSFAAAKKNMDRLESLTFWTPSLDELATEAFKNSQVINAWGVEKQLENFLKRKKEILPN